MSSLKDNVTKQVEIIDKAISNEDEKLVVMHAIQNMIQEFIHHIVELTEGQNELDEKVTEIYEKILDIESTIYDDGDSLDDMMDTCPYCGEDIIVIKKEGSNEFECPRCHNIIEIEDVE